MNANMSLAVAFLDRHPLAAVRALEDAPSAELRAFVESLTPERRDLVLRSIAPQLAAAVVLGLDESARASTMQRMPLEAAARLLRCMGPDQRGPVLLPMPVGRRRRLERAVVFSDHTAGGTADLEPPTVTDQQDVAAALKHGQKRAPDLPYVFVTDRDGRLLGVASKSALRRARPGAPVSEVMEREVHGVSAYAPVASLLAHPAWQEVDVLPVVDASGVLVGVLSHRALRRRAGVGQTQARGAVEGGALALGTAYCDLLARALVAVTTAPVTPEPAPAQGGAS